MKIFVRNVRERAQELQLSHAEVARRCGLTERRFGHYVAGTREPDLATFLKICTVLDTTPNALLGVDDTKRRKGEVADLYSGITAGLSSLGIPNLRAVKALVDSMIVQQRATKSSKALSS
jgi:transcriptional regulator with XRE-family HTH domain